MSKKIDKIPLTSLNISLEKQKELMNALKQILPEAVLEDNIDFSVLKSSLGEHIQSDNERFGLSWPGKRECMLAIQTPSNATLKPIPEDSVAFDTTNNVFIEGDNLEVLKLLQKPYFGKVKMIYIDPPYNTGKEFVYPDNWSENLETYLKYTGQKDDEGFRFTTNTESAGRYHSRWLSMMHPRLYLAKNLLRDDGVIFISIDDHEQHHLRMVCDEVFGKENFVGCFVWKKRSGANDSANFFSTDHEYVLCYGRNTDSKLNGIKKYFVKYTNPDNDPRGEWTRDNITCNKTASERPNLFYPITNPETNTVYECNPNRVWRFSKEKMHRLIQENKVIFPQDCNGAPSYKRHKAEVRHDFAPTSSLLNVPLNLTATKQLRSLFGQDLFHFPKSIELISQFIALATSPASNDIILDFFAGSCTTAHATMQLNAEDGGNRQYIMVQLPEPTSEKSEAFNAGYKTIAEIGKERIRRAGKKIEQEAKNKNLDISNLDLGFRAFKLDSSNFATWQDKYDNLHDLKQSLLLHAEDHIDPSSSSEDILYEVLLKAGFLLNTKVEKLDVLWSVVFAVNEHSLLVCLEKKITDLSLFKELAKLNPLTVICLDSAFLGDDKLKINAISIFKTHADQESSEIVLRVI